MHPTFTRTVRATALSAGDVLTGRLADQEVVATDVTADGSATVLMFDRQTLVESTVWFRADRRVVVER